jgi:hypothetical protein
MWIATCLALSSALMAPWRIIIEEMTRWEFMNAEVAITPE